MKREKNVNISAERDSHISIVLRLTHANDWRWVGEGGKEEREKMLQNNHKHFSWKLSDAKARKGKKNFDWFNNKKNMKMLCDAINTKKWASQFSQLKNYHTNTKHTEFTSIQRSVDESAIWKNNKQVKPAQSLESDWVGAQREFITFFSSG